MGKTLIIAEKPSVGQDLARVLPGPFQKHMGPGERANRWLEGPEHIVTWAVGHLVQLAEPDEYDDKYKKWRMADLPIVPRHFKLVVRDERSQKQMAVVRDLLKRDDVDRIVNACDAGREGELIFKWVIEQAGGTDKPVERLWLSSMTKQAMRDALAHLRPDEEMKTPTLAILTRREEEIRAFKPEKYWLVDAKFATDDDRRYAGRYHAGTQPRLKSAAEADAIVAAVRGKRGEITKLEKSKRTERAPLLFDLTSLQREANTRFGFSARRTLAAAQRCYEEHKVLTYPRTSSRYLTSDMVSEIKPTAAQVGSDGPEYAAGAKYVTSLDLLPLARVVDDAKVGDHHAIIPTNSPHALSKLNSDDRRVFDLVARRFLAVFHPDAVFENTRVETTVEQHVFRTRGRVLLVPGWRGVYGEVPEGDRSAADEDEGADQQLPRLERGEEATARAAEALEKETKPPRRYTDASLLGAMETAGKLVDDDELREAMKDSGIGTPATRAAIIERLIDVGYIEREGRALVATEKGLNVIRLLAEHPLTSPALTGDWERRLSLIERGEEARERFMSDIAKFAGETVGTLDTTLKDVRIPRANLGPCPICGHDIVENRKGFSCWSREDPGCGFVIWKAKAGKQLPAAAARELIATGRTEKPVTGFKGRSGRSFRARLALQQSDDGKWRVEFDEPWAREGVKPPEEEPSEGGGEGAASDTPAAA
jgi:DNA topoisomerase-3